MDVLKQRFVDYISAHHREHVLMEKALEKAEQTQNIRLDGLNNLRSQMDAERSSFVTREVMDAFAESLRHAVESNTIRVIELEKANSRGDGRSAAYGVVAIVISLLIAAGGLFLRVR